MAETTLLFLHVPKTAGMTLRSVLARQYKHRKNFIIGEDINGDIIEFRSWPANERFSYQTLQGHMSFGLHEYMRQPSCYLTMLRDPVKRAVSDYHFITGNPLHSVYHVVKDMSLIEFMNSNVNGQISNGQTRLLSGDHQANNPGIPSMREMTETDLDTARKNLAEFFIAVGIQEKFDESLMLFKRRLGWRYPFYTKTNVTPKSYSAENISMTERSTIEQRNQFDMVLYEFAGESFNKAVSDAGEEFAKSLSTFRLLNHAYQNAARLSWRHQRKRLGNLARKIKFIST